MIDPDAFKLIQTIKAKKSGCKEMKNNLHRLLSFEI